MSQKQIDRRGYRPKGCAKNSVKQSVLYSLEAFDGMMGIHIHMPTRIPLLTHRLVRRSSNQKVFCCLNVSRFILMLSRSGYYLTGNKLGTDNLDLRNKNALVVPVEKILGRSFLGHFWQDQQLLAVMCIVLAPVLVFLLDPGAYFNAVFGGDGQITDIK